MNAAIRKDAITETYIDVEKLIYDTAHKFRKRYGGDLEEIISQANYLFVMSYYHNYKQINISFTSRVRHYIWHGLLSDLRKEHLSKRYREQDIIFHTGPKLGFVELLDEVGNDAKNVINLILDTPEELLTIITDKRCSPKQSRTVIKEHLKKIGWSLDRIRNSFNEITRAVNDI